MAWERVMGYESQNGLLQLGGSMVELDPLLYIMVIIGLVEIEGAYTGRQ